MNMNTKLTNPEIRRMDFRDFKGVDYTDAKINAVVNRASDMRNFIRKNGVNQKREGYQQFLEMVDANDTPLSINGFWELKDSYGNTHVIVHAGNRIFKINDGMYTDITTTNTYNPIYTTLTAWNNKLKNSITNEISYSVVRRDRMYILCGIYLVYGTWNGGTTWELRIVEDNVDTYIPTTTTHITSIYSTTNVRSILDEVNMMSTWQKNALIGESLPAIELSNYLTYLNEEGQSFDRKWSVQNETFSNVFTLKLLAYVKDSINALEFNIDIFQDNVQHTITQSDIAVDMSFYISNFSLTYKYDEENDSMFLIMQVMPSTNANGIVEVEAKLLSRLEYQLDTTSISNNSAFLPKVTIKTVDTNTTFTLPINGMSSARGIAFNYSTGILTFTRDYPPEIEGQSNITISFVPKEKADKILNGNKTPASKINGCKFGIMFGLNDIEHFFVSGNPNYNNYDWHTSYASNTESDMTTDEDLTYFGDLGYAVFGSTSSKIMGYSLLEDGTLGIHKDYSPNETALYIRTPIVSDVVDAGGDTIRNISGTDTLQKVYFQQYSSGLAEGLVSTQTIATLVSDKLMLSKNGVFGIMLNQNIKTNERIARERSRLINTNLLKEEGLHSAKAIIFDSRYYLAINGKVYIADSRFKTQLQDELEDTFSYEWWVWDNVPVRTWFIYQDKLCFGTDDGKLCAFEEGTIRRDVTYQKMKKGDITLINIANGISSTFSYNVNKFPNLKEGMEISFESGVKEKLRIPELYLEGSDLLIEDVLHVGKYDIYMNDILYDTINVESNPILTNHLITNVTNGTFQLREKDNNDIVYFVNTGEDTVAKLINRAVFPCIWITPILTLGSYEYSKTLLSATIVPEAFINGELEFGWKIRNGIGSIQVGGIQRLDLDDLQWDCYTFNTSDFVSSFTKKIKVKNFNFIQFYLKSINDRNCAVNALSINYIITKKNKGVR